MEERRNDYPEMKERLAKIEVLQERDVSDANEWRKRFCDKIDKMLEIMTDLPCKERQAWYDACGRQLKLLWWIIGLFVTVLLSSISMQYGMAKDLSKEINEIKTYSYGYQEHANGRIPEWRKQ